MPTSFELLADRPEEKAVLAVYRPLQEVIDNALWVLGIADGEEPDVPTETSPLLDYACAAAEALKASLSDKRIHQLDTQYFRELHKGAKSVVRASERHGLFFCGGHLGLLQGDLGLFYEATAAIEEGVDVVEGYRRALLRHVFGSWGGFWFEMAAGHLDGEYYAAPSDTDIKVLQGVLDWKPIEPPNPASGPLVMTFLQKNIMKVLKGRALTKRQLAAETCGGKENGILLYRKDELKELRDAHLVKHKRGVGYYRPDVPPPDLVP